MAEKDRIPKVTPELMNQIQRLSGVPLPEIAYYVSDTANSWLTNKLAAELSAATGEPKEDIAGVLTTTDSSGKPSLWGPKRLQQLVNGILSDFEKPPMTIDQGLYDSARQAGVAAFLTKHNIDLGELAPSGDEEYWKQQEKSVDWQKYDKWKSERPKSLEDWEREREEAEKRWKASRREVESPLVTDLKKVARTLMLKTVHLLRLIDYPDDRSTYGDQEAYTKAMEEKSQAISNFGPVEEWPKKIAEMILQYRELTGEPMAIESDKPWVQRALEVDPADPEAAGFEAEEESEPEEEEDELDFDLVDKMYADEGINHRIAESVNSLIKPPDKIISEANKPTKIPSTPEEIELMKVFASDVGNAAALVRDYLKPRWESTKTGDPNAKIQDFLSNVAATDEEKADLVASEVKIGGQHEIPEDFLIWRWRVEKIQNPGASLDSFKKMLSKPMNSQNQVARIIGKTPQSVTSQMKAYRKSNPGLQDPQIWIKIIEDSAQGATGTGDNRISVPGSLASALKPALTKSVDYVDSIADLAQHLLELRADERYMRRLRARDEETANSLRGMSPKAAMEQAAILVAHQRSRDIANQIINATQEGIKEFSDYIDKWDGKPNNLVSEDGLNLPNVVKKFFVPKLKKILHMNGVISLLPGNLLGKVEDAFAGLILKNIDPHEADADAVRRAKEGGEQPLDLDLGVIAARDLQSFLSHILTDSGVIENVMRRVPSTMKSLMRGLAEEGVMVSGISDAVDKVSKKVLFEKKEEEEKEEKLPSGSMKIQSSQVKNTFNVFRSNLKSLGDNPSVGDLKAWMKKLPKGGQKGNMSARDLVRLLTYLLD